MESLNKSQLILLALLVSFVTSIATGIVTVTLMDQAPAGVTQTINRIVERTVEKVVPAETQVSTVVREVPVIVTEEELIVGVINDSAPAIARFVATVGVGTAGEGTAVENEDEQILGSGFLVEDGLLITADKIFSVATSSEATSTYRAILDDGRLLKIERLKQEAEVEESPVAVFRVVSTPELDVKTLLGLKLAPAASMIGQTVVALGASARAGLSVSVGIVSSFLTNSPNIEALMVTQAANLANRGGPILNTKGEVIGLSYDQGLVLPVEIIKTAIKK